ncbi:hypothetical protein D0Z00_000300 [Geotrichum galactomycetum]|uniref:Uncharacterized protein n=1 Tax=Geotrichum galactomycetum TaxID=27317 RepID=A0ACB6VAL8_9ASCO|nr:hypothetical protein D0Z00_000300 [Geotrichum candidum]
MTSEVDPKPRDLKLSSQFSTLLPESSLYHTLVESERRLDALLNRKRLDLQDSLNNRGLSANGGARLKETMRVFISNTVQDQTWQRMDVDGRDFDFDISGGVPASWNLRIEGRLLNEEGDLEQRKKFSTYFTSISVEFENDEFGGTETHVAEWHEAGPSGLQPQQQQGQQQPQQVEFDVLDVRRKGSRPIKAKITLQPKQYPTKLTVSPPLRELLGLEREETRAGVVLGLWKYVKFHNLQDLEEKRVIRCDQGLKNLFSSSANGASAGTAQQQPGSIDKFLFPQVVQLLEPHLSAPQPIVIEYTIQVSKENNLGEHVYDIELELEDEAGKLATKSLLDNWDTAPEITQLDEQIARTIQALNTSRLKHKFLADLAAQPSQTIENWLESQAADLRVIMSDRGFNEEEVRHSEFYTEEVLNQSVHLFLNGNRR